MPDKEERSLGFIKTLLRDRKEVQLFDNKENRKYRKAISELRAEGIIFIPVGDYLYRSIEHCTYEEIIRFAREQDASLRTQYFNTLHSVKKYLQQEELDQLHFGGLFND